MIDQRAEDSAKDLDESIVLMRKIEPCLHGYPRSIIIVALVRLIAALLGPASKTVREGMLREIPLTIRSLLKAMDRMVRNMG